jgi:XTP/dITP diphosphohydrolase
VNRLLVATRSTGKQREFRTLLAPICQQILFPDDVGLDEEPEERQLEVHPTFELNAAAKAHWFARRAGVPVLTDDSGLEVDALAGAPGVLSRRFGGVDGPDEEVALHNVAVLLDRLKEVPDRQRTARYRTVLVLVRPARADVMTAGVCEGRITQAPRGAGGFGYDPIFSSTDLRVTFAEASVEAKARVSHRARAVAALAAILRNGG